MTTLPTLISDEETLTLFGLIKKAAEHKGLQLHEVASKAYSKNIIEYPLNDHLIIELANRGIRHHPRPDGIFTLCDDNPQPKPLDGLTSSNYWNFWKDKSDHPKFDFRISLSFGFEHNVRKRGIVFWPRAYGTGVSAADNLPNFRMFKALTECDNNALPIAKEIAASDGFIIVTYSDIGLGGIRSMFELFQEFANNKDSVLQLSRNTKIFNPAPEPLYQQPGDRLFVVEPAQPKLFNIWTEQLTTYRQSLE